MRYLFLFPVMMPASALAHAGHVAEVAGHTHWIGLAAAVGAAVLGAWLAGSKAKETPEATDSAQDDATGAEEQGA